MTDNERKSHFLRLVLSAMIAVLLLAGGAHARTLSLKAPAISNNNGNIVAQFGVKVMELPILKGELEDGVELVLKCSVELVKVRHYWLDSNIGSDHFESSIKYDPLTKEFLMVVPGRSQPIHNANLKALLEEGWGRIQARLGAWDSLERGSEYSLRLITTMNEADAPDGFYRFVYFWSWDAGSDNTFHLNFTF